MINIEFEGKKYNGKHIFVDLTLVELQKVLNIQSTTSNPNNDSDDKCIEVLSLISDMDKDTLELGDIDDLNAILKELMEMEMEITNSIIIDDITYSTFRDYKEFTDIKMNKNQFKIVKNVILATNGNKIDYLADIAAVFFMEKEDFLLNDMESYHIRKEVFKNKMLSKTIVPYMFKFINSMATHAQLVPIMYEKGIREFNN